jgi:hypothetical protein
MQRLADQLIGDVRPVVLRRIDVVYPQLDRAPQHSERLVAIARRPEHAGSR